MKLALAAALFALASAGAVQAKTDRTAEFQTKMEQQRKQALRTKGGLQPRSREELRAERLAKAEREAAVKQASNDVHRRHEAVFAQVDSDQNGRINLDEFKEAALHLEGASSTKLP